MEVIIGVRNAADKRAMRLNIEKVISHRVDSLYDRWDVALVKTKEAVPTGRDNMADVILMAAPINVTNGWRAVVYGFGSYNASSRFCKYRKIFSRPKSGLHPFLIFELCKVYTFIILFIDIFLTLEN